MTNAPSLRPQKRFPAIVGAREQARSGMLRIAIEGNELAVCTDIHERRRPKERRAYFDVDREQVSKLNATLILK